MEPTNEIEYYQGIYYKALPMIPISLWDWDNIDPENKGKDYYGIGFVFLEDDEEGWYPVKIVREK